MTQVDRVMEYERVVIAGSEEGGQNRGVLPKKKSVSWIEDLVAQFSK